jgi:hypothetical protein
MVIANALYPRLPATTGPKSTDWPMSLWVARRRLNDLELQRLSRTWKGPIGETPFLPLDRGPELTAALQERLGAL